MIELAFISKLSKAKQKKSFQTWNKKSHSFIFSKLIIMIMVLVPIFQLSHAAEVTLAWDSSDQASGYILYYGLESRTYENMIDVSNNLQHTVTNLRENQLYYFAVRAYNEFGESEFSDVIFTKTGVNIAPVPSILANGFAGTVSIRQGTPISINVALDSADYAGEEADCWVFAKTPDGEWYYFDYSFSQWRYASSLDNISSSYQGVLGDVDHLEISVIDTSNLFEGEYHFYFAIDMIMNESLDYDELYYDTVRIILTP